MVKRGYCYACDKPLSGKQRRWCSDACRKRVERLSDNPGSSENRPQNNTDVRLSSEFVRVPSANEIIIEVVVRYNDNGYQFEYSGFTIKHQFREELERFIRQKLLESITQWTFEVVKVEVRKG